MIFRRRKRRETPQPSTSVAGEERVARIVRVREPTPEEPEALAAEGGGVRDPRIRHWAREGRLKPVVLELDDGSRILEFRMRLDYDMLPRWKDYIVVPHVEDPAILAAKPLSYD